LCARSNAILGAGIPPVAALLREGSPIAVGTDSLASTPDLDLLAEARALAAVATGQGYDEPDLAARILHACTAGGAYAIGRSDLGVLEPGATAALAHVTVDQPAAADIVAEIIRTGRAEPAYGRADSGA
jgi:aminodeoxyfutalosine deaminase